MSKVILRQELRRRGTFGRVSYWEVCIPQAVDVIRHFTDSITRIRSISDDVITPADALYFTACRS